MFWVVTMFYRRVLVNVFAAVCLLLSMSNDTEAQLKFSVQYATNGTVVKKPGSLNITTTVAAMDVVVLGCDIGYWISYGVNQKITCNICACQEYVPRDGWFVHEILKAT